MRVDAILLRFHKSSVIIDHIQAHARASNYGLAYVYFDYMEQTQQTLGLVLASLVKQLLGQLPQIPTGIQDLHERLRGGQKRPNFEDLFGTLRAILTKFSRIFLVFDALDECDQENQRKDLLPLFHRLVGLGINVFLTSRPHPEDIQLSLSNAEKVQISAKKEDIAIYVEQTINQNPRARRIVEQGKCKDMIIAGLVDCARGMQVSRVKNKSDSLLTLG